MSSRVLLLNVIPQVVRPLVRKTAVVETVLL